jgi:hypothetical protein
MYTGCNIGRAGVSVGSGSGGSSGGVDSIPADMV